MGPGWSFDQYGAQSVILRSHTWRSDIGILGAESDRKMLGRVLAAAVESRIEGEQSHVAVGDRRAIR